jgi:hypothetical protein
MSQECRVYKEIFDDPEGEMDQTGIVPPCMHPEVCARTVEERRKEFFSNLTDEQRGEPQNEAMAQLMINMESCAINMRAKLALGLQKIEARRTKP